MQYLQQALDDPDPTPCGRCSVCTGVLPPPGPKPAAETVAAARQFFRGLDVVVEPRKLWPARLEQVKGRIDFLAEGRAIAYADDPAWQDALSSVWRDAPAPPEILDAAVEVLKRWSRRWERPSVVVPMPSRRFPALIDSVAQHLGRVGRLPVLDALQTVGRRPTDDAASGVRVRELFESLALRPDVRFDGPVLLVDDTVRSRWTMTVAAKLITDAGASSVLPFAIHQLP
jgi:ATP-dependent DNA helicase RecQ